MVTHSSFEKSVNSEDSHQNSIKQESSSSTWLPSAYNNPTSSQQEMSHIAASVASAMNITGQPLTAYSNSSGSSGGSFFHPLTAVSPKIDMNAINTSAGISSAGFSRERNPFEHSFSTRSKRTRPSPSNILQSPRREENPFEKSFKKIPAHQYPIVADTQSPAMPEYTQLMFDAAVQSHSFKNNGSTGASASQILNYGQPAIEQPMDFGFYNGDQTMNNVSPGYPMYATFNPAEASASNENEMITEDPAPKTRSVTRTRKTGLSDSPKAKRRRKRMSEIDEEKRKELLEQNRIAAKKSRIKRKQELGHDQERFDQMEDENAHLRAEVDALLAEMETVRTLLAKNRHCYGTPL